MIGDKIYTIEYTLFGQTKNVKASSINGATPNDYDEILYIGRYEDYYALSSPLYQTKKVLVVNSEDWHRALS